VTGAVPYYYAHSFHPPLAAKAVQVYPFFERDALEEAKTVVRLVQETKRKAPDTTIAILVRSRTHLSEIVPLLREARLRFRAIDIEPLGSRPVVQDLVALTKALFHPADRLSWLTVLRAPWCGLTLQDLYTLVSEDLQAVIWDQLNNEFSVHRLSREGYQRLSKVRPIFAKALAERRRIPPRRLVEGVWLALGGPACLAEPTALEEAYVYLDLLECQAVANEVITAQPKHPVLTSVEYTSHPSSNRYIL
jgi:ATP-dependent helicase/nuclease subunit A